MVDIFSKLKRSQNMARVKSKDTKLEIKVRKWLFSKGLRYRLHYKLPGKPDIVFPSKNIVVFVHGCFWHMHDCKYSSIPLTNENFWNEKLNKNKERDKITIKKLNEEGWKVLVIWQCEINTLNKFEIKMNKLLKSILQ